MKLSRNYGKFITAASFFGISCAIYIGILRYLDERQGKPHRNAAPSARYFQNIKQNWSMFGGVESGITKNENSLGEEIKNDDDPDEINSSSKVEFLSSKERVTNGRAVAFRSDDDHDVNLTRHPETSMQHVLKILDFNHRRNHPLNYSFKGCEYSACEFTENPQEADMVMINGARLGPLKLPPRRPGQIWLMYTKEPPTFVKQFKALARGDFRDQVNWTRCIFRDCTFRGHYGRLTSRQPSDKDYEKIYDQKKYEATWFVSHCDSQSRRDEYVKLMSSELNVHTYGRCGNRTCGSGGLRLDLYGSKDRCLNQVSADYKFYLAFENSLCSDYVTEKFYKLFENVDVIPVVRGGANYSELAPDGSYVNAKDFKSPVELGRYLRKLANNKKEYIRMLKIKDRFVNTFPNPSYPCDLCKALHTRREVPSVYPDILTWMTNHCWEPDDL